MLTTWNSDEVTKEALDFCKWWLSHATSRRSSPSAAARAPCKSVYYDPEYVTYRPWNRAWAPSLDWQKDVWHVPEFFELLVKQQEQYEQGDHRLSRTPRRRWTTSPPSRRSLLTKERPDPVALTSRRRAAGAEAARPFHPFPDLHPAVMPATAAASLVTHRPAPCRPSASAR